MPETHRRPASPDDTEGFRAEVLDRLKSIEEALMGNNMGTTGLVPRLSRVEKRQALAEKIYFIGSGIILTLGLIYRVASDYWIGHN